MVGQTVTLSTARNVTDVERSELSELEKKIERGLGTFVEVGDALLKIRDGRLYRDSHGTFEEYCRERWGMSRRHANRLIESAEVSLTLGPTGPKPATERHARPLAQVEPEHRREVWQRAVDTAPEGKVTASHVESVVREMDQEATEMVSAAMAAAYLRDRDERQKTKNLGVHFTSDSPEWYTPPEIIERAVKLFGAIDLDPCSNSHKNPTVPSANRFTKDDDGLSKTWKGKVYMNPPYGREIVEWVEKLAAEHKSGNVTEAVALVPARTDTEWFRMLRVFPRCFVSGRLNFSGHENSAPFPSVVFYLGKRLSAFVKAFGDIGDVYTLAS